MAAPPLAPLLPVPPVHQAGRLLCLPLLLCLLRLSMHLHMLLRLCLPLRLYLRLPPPLCLSQLLRLNLNLHLPQPLCLSQPRRRCLPMKYRFVSRQPWPEP